MANVKSPIMDLRETVEVHKFFILQSLVSDLNKGLEGTCSILEKAFVLGKMEATLSKKQLKDLQTIDKSILTDDDRTQILGIEQQFTVDLDRAFFDFTKSILNGIHNPATDKHKVATKAAILVQKSLKDETLGILQKYFRRARFSGKISSIVDGVGIYAFNKGLDTRISLVTDNFDDPTYKAKFTENGSPRILRLGDFLEKSFTDRFELKVIPDGVSWLGRKSVITDADAYYETLSKAKIVGVSLGSPAKSKITEKTEDSSPCPFGGGEKCLKYGGDGANAHSNQSEEMKNHFRFFAEGNLPDTVAGKEQIVGLLARNSINWSKKNPPTKKILDHLAHGKIAIAQRLGERLTGVSPSYKITIEGNGSGLAKHAMKLDETFRETHGGAGIGVVPEGSNPQREVAAYHLCDLLGLTGYVPPTTIRFFIGDVASVQHWEHEFKAFSQHVFDLAKKPRVATFPGSLLKKFFYTLGTDEKNRIQRIFSDCIVFDLLMNNNDRNLSNLLISEKHEFRFIDHGLCFGNGMLGYDSSLHQEMHNLGMRISCSDTLMQRIGVLGFGDYRRALDGVLDDWEIGQTYLRGKYILQAQNEHGFLKYDDFRGSFTNRRNTEFFGHRHIWDTVGGDSEHEKRLKKGELLFQRFEVWAREFIDANKRVPSSPDFADALELDRIKVFMGPGSMIDPREYRRQDLHLSKNSMLHLPRLGDSTVLEQVGEKSNDSTVPTKLRKA